jgi:hypothetical protein
MWNPSAATLPFPQYAQGRFDLEAHHSNGEIDQSGVGLMRRRVLPPTSSHGQLADDLFDHEQEDVEEACTGEIFQELSKLVETNLIESNMSKRICAILT